MKKCLSSELLSKNLINQEITPKLENLKKDLEAEKDISEVLIGNNYHLFF